MEFLGSSKVKSAPFYPQRVSPDVLNDHISNWTLITSSPNLNSDSEPESSLNDNSAESSSSEFEAETEVIVANKKKKILFYALISLCSLF